MSEPEHYAALLVGAEGWAIDQVRDEIRTLNTIVGKMESQLADAHRDIDEAWKALGGDLTGSLPEAIGQLHKILAETREQRDRALALVDRSAALLDFAVRPDIHARVVRERDRALAALEADATTYRAMLLMEERFKKREGYHVQGKTLGEWADFIEELGVAGFEIDDEEEG